MSLILIVFYGKEPSARVAKDGFSSYIREEASREETVAILIGFLYPAV